MTMIHDMVDMTAIMLLDPTQVEKCQEKCNDVVRILVTDEIKHDYPEGKQLVNLSHTFVVNYHDSFCYHGELYNYHMQSYSSILIVVMITVDRLCQ